MFPQYCSEHAINDKSIGVSRGLPAVFRSEDNVSGLISLLNGKTTFMGYLIPKPSLLKDSSGTI